MKVLHFENRWHVVESRDVDGSLALAWWVLLVIGIGLFAPVVRWWIWGTR